jgi:hypothetical protein
MVFTGRYLMKDSEKADVIYRKIMAEKTGEERLLMGFSMLNFARRIVLSSIGKDTSPTEQRKKLFLRFYREDLEQKERDAILRLLEQESAQKLDPEL